MNAILFRALLAEAISEFTTVGYTSVERVATWVAALRNALERELGPDREIYEELRRTLGGSFDRFLNGRKLDQIVPGVGRYTKELVKPKLYAELDRRILAAADLIKLHKTEAVDRTLRRFQGWSTSIPPGGDETIDRRETKGLLGKDLRSYRYHKRLVANDQSHKLIANVADLVATEAGAIAARWNSHGAHDPSYNARKDHLSWDGQLYVVRDSWAHREGLIKPVHGYTDDVPLPGQPVNCRCWYSYITSPRKLPDEMLTRRGQEWIARGRDELARRMAS